MVGGQQRTSFRSSQLLLLLFVSILGAIDGRKVVSALVALLVFGAAGVLPGRELHGQGLPKEPRCDPWTPSLLKSFFKPCLCRLFPQTDLCC